ncbi:14210_t:CDS:2, partial [Entrophospora sp. SA101]
WAVCLNAEYNGKAQSYYLAKNLLNFRKLKKILSDYVFPSGEWQVKKTDFKLRPYQEKDVNFLSQQKNIGIFNEMRTGKTPTALAIFQHIFKIDSKYFRNLRKNKKPTFCSLIDEAHYLRNYQSQQSKSIYTLKDMKETEIPKAPRAFKIKRVLGFKNERMSQELQRRLNQISVARKQKEFLAKLKTLTLFPPALIHEERDKKDFLTEEDRKSLKDCPGSKIAYLVNFCQTNSQQSLLIFSTRTETFLEPLAQALQEKKLKVALLTGKIPHQQRIEFINDFQQQKIKILLCNIQSAGLGLNLSQADIAVFADRSYSPADNEQAEARFLPTKESENPKTRLIIDLVCKGTIDEKILTLLKRKKDITKIITSHPEYLL